MTSPSDLTTGQWVKVVAGPQKGKSGIVDLVQQFKVGQRVRVVINPHAPQQQRELSWFEPNELTPTTAPTYQSQVTGASRQRALDLITKGSKA